MVSLTCSDMGGPCDEVIQGEDKAQLVSNAMTHVKEKHPEMVPDIEKMTDEEKTAWDAKVDAKLAEQADRPMTEEEHHEEKEVEMI